MFIRNVRWFYWIAAFQAFWFVEPVWYFYWHRFANYSAIGIFLSIVTVMAILVELPTGVFADKFGRKLSTVIGTFLFAFGTWVIALSISFSWLILGVVFQTLGRAFISGALEALLYDSLKVEGKEDLYDQIASRKSQLQMACFALAVVIGGFLYQVYFRLPHLLMATTLTMSWVFSLLLKEPPRYKSQENLWVDAVIGMKQLLVPSLRPYVVPMLMVTITFLLYDWGFLKPDMAVHFNMFSQEQGVVFAIMAFINTFLIGLIPKMRQKVSDLRGLQILNLLIAAGYALALLPLGWWGVGALFLVEIGGFLAEPWISVIINRHIPSSYRATALSAVQLIARIPYVLINMIAGRLIDLGQSGLVFLWLSVGIVAVLMLDGVVKYWLVSREVTPAKAKS